MQISFETLLPFICKMLDFLNKSLENGMRILIKGKQNWLLLPLPWCTGERLCIQHPPERLTSWEPSLPGLSRPQLIFFCIYLHCRALTIPHSSSLITYLTPLVDWESLKGKICLPYFYKSQHLAPNGTQQGFHTKEGIHRTYKRILTTERHRGWKGDEVRVFLFSK